ATKLGRDPGTEAPRGSRYGPRGQSSTPRGCLRNEWKRHRPAPRVQTCTQAPSPRRPARSTRVSPMRPLQDTSQSSQTRAGHAVRTTADTHADRKRRLEEDARHIDRISRLISTFRLITLVSAVALGFLRGFGYLPPWAWGVAAALIVAFAVLVIWHIRLDR